MIVAWHEVPGIAPPQKSRPVGYGMIVQVCAPIRRLEDEISNAVSVSRREIEMTSKFIGGILDHLPYLVSPLPVGSAAPDHTVPYRTVPSGDVSQALRAWSTISLSLRDKSHSPIEGRPIKLALMR